MFFPPRRITYYSTASLAFAFAVFLAIPAHGAQRLPKSCVWRVTNAKAPFYLVGSIHALGKSDYPLPAPYEVALRNSKRFLFEFDPMRAAEFEKKFETAARYPRGQDIRSKIDPSLLSWLRQNILTVKDDRRRDKRAGVAGFDSQLAYKPWWIAQHLVGPATYTKGSTSNSSTSRG